jgi:LAO/AO transport system kinase
MEIDRLLKGIHRGEVRAVARAISMVEDRHTDAPPIMQGLDPGRLENCLTVGITGPPGAGKSTLTGSLVRELRKRDQRVGIIAVDPSSPLTGGALLGDRIRMMDHALDPDVLLRSMATRGRLGGLCGAAGAAMRIMAASGCRVVLIETVGIGQSEMDVVSLADITVMVLAPGFGDDIQAMKAGILEVVDLLVINKADQPGAQKLLLDLGRETADSDRVLQTVASENRGTADLLDRILDLEQTLRGQDELTHRRERAQARETLDWCMEMLKPKILHLLHNCNGKHQDPGITAQELVARFTRSADDQQTTERSEHNLIP